MSDRAKRDTVPAPPVPSTNPTAEMRKELETAQGKGEGMKRFILDLGREYEAEDDTGSTITIPRFAFWAVRRRFKDGKPLVGSRPVVVAVSSDLEQLIEKHGDMPLFRIEDMNEGQTDEGQ